MLDQNYINLKNQVIKAERRVLKELGFCVHVKHPHKVTYLMPVYFLTDLYGYSCCIILGDDIIIIIIINEYY